LASALEPVNHRNCDLLSYQRVHTSTAPCKSVGHASEAPPLQTGSESGPQHQSVFLFGTQCSGCRSSCCGARWVCLPQFALAASHLIPLRPFPVATLFSRPLMTYAPAADRTVSSGTRQTQQSGRNEPTSFPVVALSVDRHLRGRRQRALVLDCVLLVPGGAQFVQLLHLVLRDGGIT
jgi:hypothetical protein